MTISTVDIGNKGLNINIDTSNGPITLHASSYDNEDFLAIKDVGFECIDNPITFETKQAQFCIDINGGVLYLLRKDGEFKDRTSTFLKALSILSLDFEDMAALKHRFD